MKAETEDELKDRWETHRLVFKTLMEKLNDPESPNNAALTEEAQIHLSAMLRIKEKLNEMSKNDDEKGKEKTKEESKVDDTDGKAAEEIEK